MSDDDVAAALDTASEIVGLGALSPGPIGVIAKIASMALKAGAALAKAGKDPVIEIERILSAEPEVAKAEGDWDEYAKGLFGGLFGDATVPSPPPAGRRKTDPPPASESTPSSFEKRETDPTMAAVTGDEDDEDPYEGD
jgi:hypothetical protein